MSTHNKCLILGLVLLAGTGCLRKKCWLECGAPLSPAELAVQEERRIRWWKSAEYAQVACPYVASWGDPRSPLTLSWLEESEDLFVSRELAHLVGTGVIGLEFDSRSNYSPFWVQQVENQIPYGYMHEPDGKPTIVVTRDFVFKGHAPTEIESLLAHEFSHAYERWTNARPQFYDPCSAELAYHMVSTQIYALLAEAERYANDQYGLFRHDLNDEYGAPKLLIIAAMQHGDFECAIQRYQNWYLDGEIRETPEHWNVGVSALEEFVQQARRRYPRQ
jgi:hypothetical protein